MLYLVLAISIMTVNAEVFRTCVIDSIDRTYCSNKEFIQVDRSQMTTQCEFFKYDAMLCNQDKSYCGCMIKPSNCTNNSTDVFTEVGTNDQCDRRKWIALFITSITLWALISLGITIVGFRYYALYRYYASQQENIA